MTLKILRGSSTGAMWLRMVSGREGGIQAGLPVKAAAGLDRGAGTAPRTGVCLRRDPQARGPRSRGRPRVDARGGARGRGRGVLRPAGLQRARARHELRRGRARARRCASSTRSGVRGYVALNTLVFDEELGVASRRAVRACAEAGVDAVIVQDLGVARLVRAVAPALPDARVDADDVHRRRGRRARALARGDAASSSRASCRSRTSPPSARQTDVELEVFVHGALCISYSGQCLTSEAIGGRSANRGACAQACRLPYELVVDGELRDPATARTCSRPKTSRRARSCRSSCASASARSRSRGGSRAPPTWRRRRASTGRRSTRRRRARAAERRPRQAALQTFTRGLGPGVPRRGRSPAARRRARVRPPRPRRSARALGVRAAARARACAAARGARRSPGATAARRGRLGGRGRGRRARVGPGDGGRSGDRARGAG